MQIKKGRGPFLSRPLCDCLDPEQMRNDRRTYINNLTHEERMNNEQALRRQQEVEGRTRQQQREDEDRRIRQHNTNLENTLHNVIRMGERPNTVVRHRVHPPQNTGNGYDNVEGGGYRSHFIDSFKKIY